MGLSVFFFFCLGKEEIENLTRIQQGVGFSVYCLGLFFLHFLCHQTYSKSNIERK